MANIINPKTIEVPVGTTYLTSLSCRSIDMLYYGTVDGVTFLGNSVGSMPIPLPPSIPFTFEFNENGYNQVLITNNGDASVWVVEKL
jgi:hypothetical protein